jgi:hypothetical protein
MGGDPRQCRDAGAPPTDRRTCHHGAAGSRLRLLARRPWVACREIGGIAGIGPTVGVLSQPNNVLSALTKSGESEFGTFW